MPDPSPLSALRARRTAEDQQSVSAYDLRTRLPEILHRVAYGGERVVITYYGKPVAAIIPVRELELLPVAPGE